MQVLYNGSQPLSSLSTSAARASAWLQHLNTSHEPLNNPAPLLKLSVEARAKLTSPASLHPALAEVLRGLAVVPGMQHVLRCTQGVAYASILAQADVGLPIGPQQVPPLLQVYILQY